MTLSCLVGDESRIPPKLVFGEFQVGYLEKLETSAVIGTALKSCTLDYNKKNSIDISKVSTGCRQVLSL